MCKQSFATPTPNREVQKSWLARVERKSGRSARSSSDTQESSCWRYPHPNSTLLIIILIKQQVLFCLKTKLIYFLWTSPDTRRLLSLGPTLASPSHLEAVRHLFLRIILLIRKIVSWKPSRVTAALRYHMRLACLPTDIFPWLTQASWQIQKPENQDFSWSGGQTRNMRAMSYTQRTGQVRILFVMMDYRRVWLQGTVIRTALPQSWRLKLRVYTLSHYQPAALESSS